ncbi:MAG: hypothetical protein JXC85_04735 [Candidatus Aenigmarchaeota archaeon]|nr:hypothetical protein [Candidatus Aenigmarchaeota archaeon]
MASIKELEKEIERIKGRNERVEQDKAWETSKTRKSIIALFTYLAIALYMQAINLPAPWLNAIVPTVGFLLSTLTLPLFRRLWADRAYGDRK